MCVFNTLYLFTYKFTVYVRMTINSFSWFKYLMISWRVNSVILIVCVCTQLCLTLWDPMNCNPPGSSVHGIFQARILEWVATSSSRDWTHVSCISRLFFFFFFTTSHLESPSVIVPASLIFINIWRCVSSIENSLSCLLIYQTARWVLSLISFLSNI